MGEAGKEAVHLQGFINRAYMASSTAILERTNSLGNVKCRQEAVPLIRGLSSAWL